MTGDIRWLQFDEIRRLQTENAELKAKVIELNRQVQAAAAEPEEERRWPD